jgi:hypothetical protein
VEDVGGGAYGGEDGGEACRHLQGAGSVFITVGVSPLCCC